MKRCGECGQIVDEWIGSREAARRLHVTERTIREYVDSGRLEAFVLPSGHRRISRNAVERMIGDGL